MKAGVRDWIVAKLADHDEVHQIDVVADQEIRIIRRRHRPFNSILLDCSVVQPSSFFALIDGYSEFVMSLREHTVWTGDAIEIARRSNVGWGGLGDLMSGINKEDISVFQRKEFTFVERGLLQHTQVFRLDRVNNRIFVVHRASLPSIRVVLINEYELTADSVRFHRNTYGPFDEVLSTNPSARVSSIANRAATDMDVVIYSWGNFMSRLHRQ